MVTVIVECHGKSLGDLLEWTLNFSIAVLGLLQEYKEITKRCVKGIPIVLFVLVFLFTNMGLNAP